MPRGHVVEEHGVSLLPIIHHMRMIAVKLYALANTTNSLN
jgi:hypothetical protein